MAVWLGVTLAGCSAEQRSMPSFSTGTTIIAVGDWDDVDVAVRYGAGKAEMSVVSSQKYGEGRIVYKLLAHTDEPGTLSAARKVGREGAGREGATAVELTARVGRFGDERAERALLRAVERRLSGLAGVEVAPVR